MIAKLREWIRAGNDCANCPACWSDECYTDCGTEYEGGCYIYGDEWPEPCRLLLPNFLRAFISRRAKYLNAHQWDGFAEFTEKREAAAEVIQDEIEERLKSFVVCWKDDDGNYHEANNDFLIVEMAWRIRNAYEDFTVEPSKTLRQKWAELIRETISIPVNYVKSYIAH